LPAFACVADAGLPPGKDQAYVTVLPSGSLPLPEKDTVSPGLIVAFVAGLTIEAVGGRFADTVSVTFAEWETGPLVPVIVSG
jgi:hypothetical protein